MFTHIFPRDRSAAADRPAQPSRFASAPAAAVPSSPRHSPGRLSAAAVTSPRANNAAADASRLRAGALPAFRLHRDRGAAARARRYHLPHVQHSGGERPEPAVYSSLEGLQRLSEYWRQGAEREARTGLQCLQSHSVPAAPTSPTAAPQPRKCCDTPSFLRHFYVRYISTFKPSAAELFKGKHSTVATYLDARTGAVVSPACACRLQRSVSTRIRNACSRAA